MRRVVSFCYHRFVRKRLNQYNLNCKLCVGGGESVPLKITMLVNEVFELFPDHVKKNELYPFYWRFLWILDAILPYVSDNKRARILDVGADGGVICMVLRRLGHDVSAIDIWERYTEIDEVAIEERSHKERLDRDGVKTYYCDIAKETFPFEDSSFDLVLCTDTIEHLHSSPKLAFEETRRVLKSGGIFVLTTPNLANLRNRLFVLAGRSNHSPLNRWYIKTHFAGHVREYTRNEVKQMLEWEGFSLEQVKLSNCMQMSDIKPLSLRPYTVVMCLYLFITTLVPQFRYLMMFVGQKKDPSPNRGSGRGRVQQKVVGVQPHMEDSFGPYRPVYSYLSPG